MPKVIEVKTSEGEFGGWAIFCPACDCSHLFDGRWTFNGDMDKPTFRNSMLVHEHKWGLGIRPRCHSFVTDGMIAFEGDSGHELAGQTVELEDWDDIEKMECVPCPECIKKESCVRPQSVVGCVRGKR